MKIIYHHRTMGRGAEGSHIANMVNAFKGLGHDVIVISPPGVDPLEKVGKEPIDKVDEDVSGIDRVWKYISRNLPQVFFELLEVFYNISSIYNFYRCLKNNKDIDFIYERSAFFLFSGAFISKIYNIPLIVEANEVVGIKRARRLIMKRLAKFIENYTVRRAKAVFAVSSYLSQKLENIEKCSTPVYISPNAIKPEQFNVITRRDEIREKYNISDKVVIGFAGWFDWWDRLDLLINVQHRLLKTGIENVASLVIGDGPIAKEIKKEINGRKLNEHVILTGPVEKEIVTDYIDALDIGVISHSNEFGSPMIMFEMMAMNKCVVAPNLLPISDVLKDKVNGLLFTASDEDELFEKVAYAVKNIGECKKIGIKAKEIVFKEHTWKKNAINVLKVVSS